VVAAHPARIVWLGAIGTGRSAQAVGRLTARLLRAGFGAEYDDKVTADATVLGAGGTVLHSGPLTDKADDPGTRASPGSCSTKPKPPPTPASSSSRR
jgi:hypothetical protein